MWTTARQLFTPEKDEEAEESDDERQEKGGDDGKKDGHVDGGEEGEQGGAEQNNRILKKAKVMKKEEIVEMNVEREGGILKKEVVHGEAGDPILLLLISLSHSLLSLVLPVAPLSPCPPSFPPCPLLARVLLLFPAFSGLCILSVICNHL